MPEASSQVPASAQNSTAAGSSPRALDKLLGRIRRPAGSTVSLVGAIMFGSGLLFLGCTEYWLVYVVPFATNLRAYYGYELIADVLVGTGVLVLAIGWARLQLSGTLLGRSVVFPSQKVLREGAALAIAGGVAVLGIFLFIAVLNGVAATGGTPQLSIPQGAEPLILWVGGAASIAWGIGAFGVRPFVGPPDR